MTKQTQYMMLALFALLSVVPAMLAGLELAIHCNHILAAPLPVVLCVLGGCLFIRSAESAEIEAIRTELWSK